ncbi:MAG: 50S ribosomal protein L3 [Candidatus Omnitrophica bacterium]|nr:50S ribosomal protein L3 [Candidatus Omnitrophota bacterium]MCF7876903.1 50S ribosomal protein L3 [Candidatus Omnitrophota bacterium]MCF7878033.1 50S ribosomal protein L3 [Candidatus Omnitrophota bacterium]MCF7893205.1 50S ribosomal protein L3 [Candidatus Omnitrophota bacterium]
MIKEIFGKKIGMTQIFGPEGELLPVTLVEVEPACILEAVNYPGKKKAKIGCFEVKETKNSKVKKPQRGYFKKVKAPVYKFIKEVEAEKDADFSFLKNEQKKKDTQEKKEAPSRYAGIEIFSQGQYITVRSKSKGKGFAGAIKRHRMRRQPSSHGSGMHRRVGSVGASATPSKIAKNKKMPGHLGSNYRVAKNLEILKIDEEKKIIFVRGSFSGSRGAIVRLTKQN